MHSSDALQLEHDAFSVDQGLQILHHDFLRHILSPQKDLPECRCAVHVRGDADAATQVSNQMPKHALARFVTFYKQKCFFGTAPNIFFASLFFDLLCVVLHFVRNIKHSIFAGKKRRQNISVDF